MLLKTKLGQLFTRYGITMLARKIRLLSWWRLDKVKGSLLKSRWTISLIKNVNEVQCLDIKHTPPTWPFLLKPLHASDVSLTSRSQFIWAHIVLYPYVCIFQKYFYFSYTFERLGKIHVFKNETYYIRTYSSCLMHVFFFFKFKTYKIDILYMYFSYIIEEK